MARVIAATCVLALITAVGWADELVLLDGRSFTGTVKVDGDNVLIVTSNATLSFTRDQVSRIEIKPTPEQELANRLAKTSATDADGMFAVAQWGIENGLDEQAQSILNKVISVAPDHAGARKARGELKIDGQWQPFARGVEVARGKLDAGQLDVLQKDLLPGLLALAASKDKQATVRELQGLAQLRGKDFAGASKTFAALSELVDGPISIRAGAIVVILKDNADGMYVLTDAYPATAGILGSVKDSLPAGPASLANPLALSAALHDRAKKEIDAGRKLMDAGLKAEDTDMDVANRKYFLATQAFDRADAMVEDIARGHRIEIIRRRIAAVRRDVEADAQKFDKDMAKLGKKDLSAQEYNTMVLSMIRTLDNVRDNLQAIQNHAKPYPRELVLEAQWAQRDLKRIEGMRKILLDDINGQK